MQCFVYRSPRKRDTYLYLPEADSFSRLPAGLMKVSGQPQLALEFELTPDIKLAAADANQVLENLREQGYLLQVSSENQLPV